MLRQPLEQAQARLGRDALSGVLLQARLLVVPRRAYQKTTPSHHRFRRHPNLLKAVPQQVTVSASEQVWVANITYLPTSAGFSIGKRLEHSSKTMRSMVNDLLEYSRTQIVGRIPIAKAECDLLHIFEAAHADANQAYTHCKFDHTSEGNFVGEFDCVRIQQVGLTRAWKE